MNVSAQPVDKSGYLQDTRGDVVKNPYGLCWRTGYWSPALAIAECDPDLVPKAAPRPTPAAPAARPAPTPMPKPAAPAAKPSAKPAVSPARAKVTLSADALFDFDKSDIRLDEMSKVSEIAAYMQRNPSSKVGIDGHTDPRGTDRYNQALSEGRVNAIRDALMKAGVPADRIQTGAFGESRLKCSESTEACWQRDRRVEVLIGTDTAGK